MRGFFFDTWSKFNHQKPLTDLEKIAISVMHMHPEYHAILDAPEQFKQQEYFPEFGETNPFLHMSLHFPYSSKLALINRLALLKFMKN